MDTTTVTVKGQITIPKVNREYMGLKPGDRVRVFNDPKGGIYILKLRPISEARPDFGPRRPVSVEDMKKGVRKKASEKNRGSRSR